MVEARANCCNPDQLLALPRLSEATTKPVLGEMVKVPLASAVTEVTAPAGVEVAMTVPAEFTARKVPAGVPRLVMAKLVVVALVEVLFTIVKLVMVEVALLTRIPPLKVERPETPRADKVPTLVSEEAVTPEARVLPDKVSAAAVIVIGAEPLKSTPLMARAVARMVAVPALPVTLPVIGLVTVRLARVPTEVREEAKTLAPKVVALRTEVPLME